MMKNIIITLLFIAQSLANTLIAMDTELKPLRKKSDVKMNEIITNISKKSLLQKKIMDLIQFSLTTNNIDDIVQTITQEYRSINPNPLGLESLCQHHECFEKALEYFITCAKQNTKKVTIKNIDIITDPTEVQPTAALNKLPPTIK